MENRIPRRKIFKDKTFWVGTFLGGPLVAGYLLSENFKTLGQPEKVKPTWIITIIATIVIFSGIFLIPENINLPNQIIPIAYSIIAYGLFKKYQEEKSNEYINSGGLIHSWWRVIAIAIIGLMITIVPVFAIVYASDTIEQASISTKTYGLDLKHEIAFNEKNISEQEIDKIAEGFRETGFFDSSVAKYVYADKNEDKYEISISVIEGIANDKNALQPFVELRSQMDDFFPNNIIEFKLTVDYLDNVVKVLK
ncbi:hypothetical protein [Psychroflexus aestuariivivens]|uniref:hypothetical protein n=1 Tax=Psychroflexus aestuariivivens TaxID=1795040 RepID=UPI000FDC02B3|nr:hypothetical protein [Psychroflexus aestuariivivens]